MLLEGIDLTYEGIATNILLRSLAGISFEGIDLTYEGIATASCDFTLRSLIVKEGIDLTYEGIATNNYGQCF